MQNECKSRLGFINECMYRVRKSNEGQITRELIILPRKHFMPGLVNFNRLRGE